MASKKKACQKCSLLLTGETKECPLCHSKDLTTSWKGKAIITDAVKSEIAKKMGIQAAGEYAVRTR
jgi:RNA polymerase subunit RPABC4/transcription elongation factor Spt4